MKPEGIEFNVNHDVWVKLTASGHAELQKQHRDITTYWGNDFEYKPPKEVEGWSKWQLRNLMQRLGHRMAMGLPLPFETNIILEKEE